MNKKINIMTLGDIFENLETDEKAFEFLKYIKELQEENKKLHKELDYADNYNIYLIAKLDKIKKYIKEEEYQEEGYRTLVIETKKINELLEEIE